MATTRALTSKDGALWVQPDGPNTEVYFLDCADVGDLTETEGAISLIRCHNAERSGWDVVGQTKAPPDPITLDVTRLTYRARNWLERARCPFAVYVLQKDCGRADVFHNYVRGDVLAHVTRTGKTRSNLVLREGDEPTTVAVSLEAWPPSIPVEELSVDRITTTEALGGNSVIANMDERCEDECGATLDLCEVAGIACDSGAGPATANVLFSTDHGATWAAGAADPFVADYDIMAITYCYVGRDTRRWIVAQNAGDVVGGQGLTAYSDDDGTTWTTTNVGGAAAGDGALYGNALFSLNNSMRHIWLASENGYIFFSDDGSQTWTAQETGIIMANEYNCVHFCDEDYGMAGGVGGVVAITSDGGNTWAAATATGGGEIYCCQRLSRDRLWVGDDAGGLYFSTDGGTTWTARIGWAGAGVGDVRDLKFVNDYVAFMLSDNATPVGTVLRTINGGWTWEALTTPDNDGLNCIWPCDESHAIFVGEVEAGSATQFIGRVSPAGE